MVSYVQSLSANFISAYYRITTWPPQKKNQVLLASSTCRPNLLCFGFDLTQSQSSKLISRNGYGPNCVPLRPCINKKAILICSTDSRSDVFAAKDGKMN